ncbi:MAG: RNA polymerase sigma factor [Thermoguttaceae bacterium]
MNGIIEQDVPQFKESLASTVVSDEELLLEYREHGSRPAFEELVRRYEKELYGYLRNYLGDSDMAEDVFQQTFLQIYLKCDQFEPERKLRPWLYAIATNQAIDHQRRFGRHRTVSLDRQMGEDDESDTGAFVELFDNHNRGPVEESENHERADEIRRAVDELPEHTRQVVLLVYFQGLKYREAAHALGIPVGTVKSRLHGGIQKLGEVLSLAHESQ